VTVLAAQTPAQPDPPTTSFATDQVTLTWVAPDNGGSPITSFTVTIRTSDDTTFLTLLDYCDGSNNAIMAATSCVIPSIVLHEADFSLPWASHVYAKVIATNLYGDSTESSEGNGAIIVAVPDIPVNLLEDYSQRSASTLGLTWEDGADPGGLTV
jgi:hypothetical protein